MARLFRHPGQQRAFLLGFDNADGLAIYEQEIIARPRLERDFADGNTPTRAQIDLLVILQHPAALA